MRRAAAAHMVDGATTRTCCCYAERVSGKKKGETSKSSEKTSRNGKGWGRGNSTLPRPDQSSFTPAMDSRSRGPRVRTDLLCRVHAPCRPQETKKQTNKEEKNHAAFEISHRTRIGARIYRRKTAGNAGAEGDRDFEKHQSTYSPCCCRRRRCFGGGEAARGGSTGE